MQSVTLPPHWTIHNTTARSDEVNNIEKIVAIPSDATLTAHIYSTISSNHSTK